MRRKIGKAMAMLAAVLPGSAARKAAYSLLFGYRFGAGSRTGWGTIIFVDSFDCGARTVISPHNRFMRPSR